MNPRVLNTAEVTDLLKNHGITSTLQRVEIARELLSKRQHLSAEQVMDKVNQGRNIVSKATVYNTLRLFSSKGLTREIVADPTRMFYEPMTTAHHHFYNIDTGELTDIDPDKIQFNDLPKPPKGCKQAGVEVIIRVNCAKKTRHLYPEILP